MKLWRVLLMSLVLSVSACAVAGSTPPDPPSEAPRSSERLEGTPADGQVAHAASELSKALNGDPRFASVEVLNGQKIVVHWDGSVDPQLQNLLARFPDVEIDVEATACLPGELRAKGDELLTSDPAVNAFSVAPDGSSVQLMLDESLEAQVDIDSLERDYSEAIGCAVEVEFGSVSPA